MSYYGQGQSGQYPDEYASHSAPPTPRDPNYQQPQQWEQQQQESQHSQVSDQMPQQTLEQALEQSQEHHQPPPTPQQSLYSQQPLEDPQHLVPTQVLPRGTHDLTPIRLHPVAGTPGRSPPVEIKPVMLQVDTTTRSTAHAGPSTRPASRARPHQYHPYTRPSSASGSSAAAHRREIEAHHHVRFASQTNTPQGSVVHSPAAGRQTFASPMSEYGPQATSPSFSPGQQVTSPAFVAGSPAFAPSGTLGPRAPPETPAADLRRYIIRADTHYDPGTRILTALLELPGMQKQDLSITLATSLFNRVRQVTVSGQSRPPFPLSLPATMPVLRERKYGRFARSFPVPADTKVRWSRLRAVMFDPSFRMPTPVPFVASLKTLMRRWRMGF
ncbi:hypothetical protein DFH08DRAFT_969632 [Mycena albidolilacea]|uniref:Uncharacterized protein n=1 Tax=Mycena albidolilacea TaxID=1033008 RepID=A0AAD6ZIF3_9AGAR|nr:hypothetical protein DFH08DRAFT_969632 [Mycena albidolilacea]